ncbi:MAG TPA: heavy metal-binding domain-containing protein [Polyangia bacterium]|nr:heavy metal-binding domain-containing protein [Polyangia bacterium]
MIVLVRALLLALAAAALAAAVAIGVRGHETAAAVYACPMHPEVRGGNPGECPICRMALERIGRPAVPAGRAGAAEAADLAAVENVRRHNIVDFVRLRSLLVPSRELRGPATVGGDGVVTALFYDDALATLAPDETGVFTRADAPTQNVAVVRLAGTPVRWDRSTSKIQFRVTSTGPRGAAPTGAVGWVELEARPRQVLAVPASAVLQAPEGPYVLAWTGSGFNFQKRPIEIGETFLKDGFAVVLSGLRANERVVGRATFFLEADRRAGARLADTESAL